MQALTLDDYTMAAFMGGTLSPHARRTTTLQLLEDADARAWLKTAAEALEAVQTFAQKHGEPTHRGPAARRRTQRFDRQAFRRPPSAPFHGTGTWDTN